MLDRQGEVVRDIERVLPPVVVPEPHDDATRSPKLSDIGLHEAGRRQAHIEAEIPAVIRTGRIEKSSDGHAEAHRQAEQLVGDDVAIPQLAALTVDRPQWWPRLLVMRRARISCVICWSRRYARTLAAKATEGRPWV